MKRKRIFILTSVLVTALSFATSLFAATQTSPQKEKPAQKTPESQKAPSGPVNPEVKLVAEMPAGAPGKIFHFPKPITKTLPNGLRVFVVPSNKEPALSVRLVLTAAGAVHDPSGKPGVANMTADLLTQGTEKRSAQQIAETIDFVGGSLSSNADSDGTYVTVSVVKKDTELAMDLLSDVVLHPTFKPEELDRRRQQLLSGLSLQYSDPGYLAGLTFERVVYGQHPYGLPNEGTPASVAALTRDDLVRFHDTYYVPKQALLAFAGDITLEAAFAAAEKYFGAWPRKEVSVADIPAPKPQKGLRILLIDKPDAVQTQIRVGEPGIRRNDPNYIPLFVTNRIFGGGFNSRLNTEVRQKKGLTYGARSSFNSRKLAGDFEASTFTRTEATVEAVKLVVDLISKMAEGSVTPQELGFARDYLVGVFPIQSETPEQVAGRVLTVAQFELPPDYNETYQEKVRAVGPEQVKAMATRYYDIGSLDLILVGNVSQFRDALKKEFPNATIEEIPFDQVDVLSADLRKPKPAGAAPATPEAMARGKSIVMQAAEASGGAALNKIESLELMGAGTVFAPQGEFPAELQLWVVYPDHLRMDTKLPFGTIQQALDGKSGWLGNPQGTMDLPPGFNADLQRAMNLAGGWGVYRQAMSGTAQLQALGEEDVEGKKLQAVEWTAGSDRVKLYFDPQTHFLAAARFRLTTPQGQVESLQMWSDFKVVPGLGDGVKFPYHSVTYRDGSKFSEATVQSLKVNTKIDPATFAKPKPTK